MMFNAHYTSLTALNLPEYFRTIHADNINEAMKIAKQYARKGYMVKSCVQNEGKE